MKTMLDSRSRSSKRASKDSRVTRRSTQTGAVTAEHGFRFDLTREQIEKILDIYRPEHRYVRDAFLTGTTLRCSLTPVVYPYTTNQLFDYITAPTTTLFACQLAYVLVGALVMAPDAEAAKPDWRAFLDLRDSALLRFATFATQFRLPVRNLWPISASISMGRQKRLASHVHCTMTFQIGEGISGSIHGVILGGTK